MDRTKWIAIVLLCAVGLGGLIYITKKDSVNVDTVDAAKIISSTSTVIGDHVYGKPDAKVVWFEYGDFQCPGCTAAAPNIKKIAEKYKDKAAFVFRNFPLTSAHPNALAASSTAEAASLQGKYWEMHDLLFTNHDEWATLSPDTRDEKFKSYAAQLGLNVDQFTADLTSSKVQRKVQTDRALGNKVNVTATPTLFIGAAKADGDTLTDNVINKDGALLMDKLDAALRAAGETPPAR